MKQLRQPRILPKAGAGSVLIDAGGEYFLTQTAFVSDGDSYGYYDPVFDVSSRDRAKV
jgi:hypothetical protein